MSDYPLHIVAMQVDGTFRSDDDGTVVTRGPSGQPFFRSMYAYPARTFTVVHNVTDTVRQTLDAHYTANKLAAFNFTYNMDGLTYLCRYAGNPNALPLEGNLYWQYTNKLVVVGNSLSTAISPVTGEINVTGNNAVKSKVGVIPGTGSIGIQGRNPATTRYSGTYTAVTISPKTGAVSLTVSTPKRTP